MATSDSEPASLPEEPASLPDEPACLPDEPACLPEEPASLPEEPASAPDQPADEVGFDCEFTELPPKAVQHECPICLQTLKEPYQATCCGYSFCNFCIDKVKATNKPCPTCNAENFDIFSNKGLKRSLYEFKVNCSHKKEGCDWVGELGDLTNHLNTESEVGCKFAWIKCRHCVRFLRRLNITLHQNSYCSQRPLTCEHCSEYNSTFEDVTNNHFPLCSKVVVSCPRQCGVTTERRNLEQHEGDCPLALVQCEFSMFGCQVKMPRQEIPAHVQTNVTQHMSMLVASHAKLTLEHANLKLEIEQMKQDQTMLLSTSAFCAPVRVTMNNFSQLKSNDAIWESPPFYSRPQGYKLGIKVYPNGGGTFRGKGVVTVFCLKKGEYDEMLPFPVTMAVKIGAVTNEGLVSHKGTLDIDHARRVQWDFQSCKSPFILRSIENLWLEDYIREDDSIQFQISKVTITT